MTHTLAAMPPVPAGAGWVTYVRCHDDIGWAITEEDAARVGQDGYAAPALPRRLLRRRVPGSFARGERFQADPGSGEARTSGTAASLAGLGRRSDAATSSPSRRSAVSAALRGRLRLRRAAADLHGRRARAAQRRGLGRRPGARRRQPLDAPAAHGLGGGRAPERPRAVEGRLWRGLRSLVELRRASRATHAHGVSAPAWTGNDHVLGLRREHAGDRLLLLANLTAEPQPVAREVVGEPLELEPYGYRWLRG